MGKQSKAFVFDAYGTLFTINATIEGLKKEYIDLSPKVQELWRTRQLEYTWLSNSMQRWVDFSQITIDALDYALDFYAVKDGDFRQSLLNIYKTPTTFEDAIPFLKTAREKGVSTAILSNGTPDGLASGAQVAGIDGLLDHLFSASSVQIFKPSAQVYAMVTEHFDCKPEEVTFFSSNAWDICGASSFGFRTVWVNRKKEPFERLGAKPDVIVKSLDEFTI